MAGISGLSGLDTATMVDQLMQLEANPQTLLKQKLAKQNKVVSALQGINTRVASLQTAAAALAKPEAWTKAAATSSSTSVAVSTTTGSGSGSLTFDVTATAAKASKTSAAVKNGTVTGDQTFTITRSAAGSTPVTITAKNGDAGTIAAAINAVDAGVQATTVRTAEGEYRLLLTAKDSGAAGGFTVSGALPAMAQETAGQDAKITVGSGTSAYSVTSPSNTFTGLMAGVSVTVSKLETGVTVTSAPDTAAVATQVAGVVGSLGVVFSEIADQTKASKDSAGALAGNTLLRGLQQQLAAAVWSTVPGATMKNVGIDLGRDGTVTFDKEAFAAFTAKEPVKAKQLITAFSTTLADVAKAASSSTDGTISSAVKTNQDTASDLTDRIADWDVRLELRRASLERQYSALEVTMSNSQAQASWLTSALASLTPTTKS